MAPIALSGYVGSARPVYSGYYLVVVTLLKALSPSFVEKACMDTRCVGLAISLPIQQLGRHAVGSCWSNI
jgi:hypothetical protein